MSKQKPDRTDEELLDALNQLFSEVETETPEELNAAIEAVGYDPDSFAARMEAIAKQAMAESPLNWRNKARTELEQDRKRLEANSARGEGGREHLLERVQALLTQFSGRPNVAYAHHRNLDKASDEDIVSLIEELEHLIGRENRSDD